MSIAIINTGTSPNSGNGDSLRSAFIKINNNFSYLESSLTNISLIQGPTGPAGSSDNVGVISASDFGSISYYINDTDLTATSFLNYNKERDIFTIGRSDLADQATGLVIFSNQYYNDITLGNSSILIAQHHNVQDSNNFSFFRTRGGAANQFPIIANDELGEITFTSLSNTGIVQNARISVSALATSTTFINPGKIYFYLNDGSLFTPITATIALLHGIVQVDKLQGLNNIQLINIESNLVPATDSTYDLGSTSSQWNNLFLNNSLQFSDNTTQTTAYNLLDAIPESSTSTGIKGQMAVSTTSLYVCVATNSWLKFDGTTF